MVISLIAGAAAGVIIAVADRLLDDRKAIKSQLFSLRALAERTRSQTTRFAKKEQDFQRQFQWMEAALAETNYHLVQIVNENIIYDGTEGIEGFDVVAGGRRDNCHFFNNRVLIIDRMGKKGVCQLQLRKYTVDGKEYDYLAGNAAAGGKRRLRVSFAAQVQDGEHALALAVTDFPENKLFSKREVTVSGTTWQAYDLYFEVPAGQDCLLQIVDLYQARSGDLQIRDLVLAEQARHAAPQTDQ